MSQKYRQQFVDALGGVIYDAIGNRNMAVLGATPTASVAGYNPGCIFINTAGAVGTFVYVNVGTLASATWMAIA